MKDLIEKFKDGVRLSVFVQPNGKKSEILGEHDGALKIRIQALPVDGMANIALEKFIATIFDVPKSRVTISRGHQTRHKTIEISQLSSERAVELLADFRARNSS